MDLIVEVMESRIRRFTVRKIENEEQALQEVDLIYQRGFEQVCGQDLGKQSWSKNGVYPAAQAAEFQTCSNCQGEKTFGRVEGGPTFDCPACLGAGIVLIESVNEKEECVLSNENTVIPYIEHCRRTEKFLPQDREADVELLEACLRVAALAGDLVDYVKKRVFYESVVPQENFYSVIEALKSHIVTVELCLSCVGGKRKTTAVNWRVLHALVGMAGEAGELAQIGATALQNNRLSPEQVLNLVEEIGDFGWYREIGLDEIGVTDEEVKAKNVAKLLARFKKEFTISECENRDLKTELQALQDN